MFEKIVYISDHSANVQLAEGTSATINLMNLHIIFEDDYKTILGEVDDLNEDIVRVRFLGEIVDGKLLGGVIRKPSLDSSIRVISEEEIPLIVGKDEPGFMELGVSPFYNDYPVYLDVNSFFSNHFAIFGNSGSGKSCGVTRLFQNMFQDERLFPYKSNILLFDSSGEYYNAFKNLNSINSNFHYRFYSTNEADGVAEKLRLPIFLLNANDLALLLQATSHSQLPIIERMLKLALVFSQDDLDTNNYKNHLIAKAIMTILYTNETSPNKRNEIFSILASCSTPQFSLETVIQGVGYTRKFRECFLIDNQGQFSESVLLTDYVSSFIKDEYDNFEPSGGVFYTLDTLEKALNFTLISEGWLRNENTYGDAVTLKVRLHSLIVGENAKYFKYDNYVSLETYLSSMLIDDGKKYQIININLDDVDDDFAKVITKIYSRLVFEFAKGLKERASIPFHIVVEEAHRYIQNDTDRFLIGYNIFERIAKEGRKYGVMLGLISQRPVELSDTVISQCSNFMIFKMNHPVDVDYIKKMVPNINDEIVEKQKTLQAGTCLGFGMAFRIPLIIKMKMPDPAPWSGNCDVVTIWNGNNVKENIKETGDEATKKEAIKEQLKDDSKLRATLPEELVRKVETEIVMPKVPSDSLLNRSSISSQSNSLQDMTKVGTFVKPDNINNISRSVPDTVYQGSLPNISNGMHLTDDWLNNLVGSQASNGLNDPSINNMNVQSAIPDFAMTSAQERELSIPTNAYSIPSSLSLVANNSAVTPTVKFEEPSDFGTVKIVPPSPMNGMVPSGFDSLSPVNGTISLGIDNSSSKFESDNSVKISAGSGMPTTDSGTPLINLIG